jgi:hypothetical protein
MNGCTLMPAAELIRIIEPPPALTRCGAPTITVFQTPVMFVLMPALAGHWGDVSA